MHLQKLPKGVCIETSTSLGSLQKFAGAAGEFKEALGSRHPLVSSPAFTKIAHHASFIHLVVCSSNSSCSSKIFAERHRLGIYSLQTGLNLKGDLFPL